MGHPRKEIRNAVVAALLGATTAGARVFPTRQVPYRRVELPALAVYTPTEDVDVETDTAPREEHRETQLVVEGLVAAGENVDDALDDLAWAVEAALARDETFGGLASNTLLAGTDLDVYEEGDKTFGVVRLRYRVSYDTRPSDFAPAGDSFTTADVRYSLDNGQAPADQAHDVVPLEEG